MVEGPYYTGRERRPDPGTKPGRAAARWRQGLRSAPPVFPKGAAIVEVSAIGPFAMTYVNPADDPTKTAAK